MTPQLKVALWEVAEGTWIPFSKKLQCDRYHGHLATNAVVKSSQEGDCKYMQLLSNIYKSVM